MRKMLFFVLAAALLLMVPAQNAQAQSETPKVEIGAHYAMLRLRLRDFESIDHGVGTRLTLNVTDGFGIESEVNFFTRGRDNLAAPTGFSVGSERTLALFGVKYGMRSERAGIFGKIRPGFMRFGGGSGIPPFIPPLSDAKTEFALDIGGVFELYASRRVAFRFDIGDTIIRFGGRGFTSHNLQITTGFALRF